jgi:hypothetical protein
MLFSTSARVVFPSVISLGFCKMASLSLIAGYSFNKLRLAVASGDTFSFLLPVLMQDC